MSLRPVLGLLLALASVPSFAAEVKQSVVAKNIKQLCYPSAALGSERCAHILLPVDYESSTDRYPVLYLLHGLGDDHTAWAYMTNLSGYASRYKIIIAMPDGGRSFYVNSAANPKEKFEDSIVQDFMPLVDKTYRTIPLPRSRAVAGLSMGGYGAAFLGLKHYKKFAALGAFSAAIGLSRPAAQMNGPNGQPNPIAAMFGQPNSDDRKARDPFDLVEKVPMAEMPAIYIACGGQDFLIASNREFVDLLSKKKIPYEYREISPRGHTWDFWDDHIHEFLNFLSRNVKGFAGI